MENNFNSNVNATPVSNSNNEALVQAAQAVVNAAQDKKPEDDKSKGKKPKRATEMSRTACFNEVTRTAHRIFEKNTPRKISWMLTPDQLVKLKQDAINEAIVKFQTKHGGDYDLKAYSRDFLRRVELLVCNTIFAEWAKGKGADSDYRKKVVAQHIVFNGAEFFERVMMNDYLEHGELQIGWHRDYGTPIFNIADLDDVKKKEIKYKEEQLRLPA